MVEAFNPEQVSASAYDPIKYIKKTQDAYDEIASMFGVIDDDDDLIFDSPEAPNGSKLIEAFKKSGERMPNFVLISKDDITYLAKTAKELGI